MKPEAEEGAFRNIQSGLVLFHNYRDSEQNVVKAET